VPTRDVRFFIGAMKRNRHSPRRWFSSVTKQDLREVLSLIRRDGALTIRDIDDDVLVDKEDPWASRKPSKRRPIVRPAQAAFRHAELVQDWTRPIRGIHCP
jgi:uncharacterized protein